jgi:hypothetical protein
MEVESVIKNQDNSRDDLYADLSEIVADIVRHLPGHDRARIIGYAVISSPSVPPIAFRVIGDDDGYRLPYETIESDDVMFITSRLPPGISSPPSVEIMPGEIRIFLEGRAATITLKFPVDISHSHYSSRNGVLDITLKKA